MVSSPDQISLTAGNLFAAMNQARRTFAARATRRNTVVNLTYNARKKELTVEEAVNGLFAFTVSAVGKWRHCPQISGRQLLELAGKYDTDAILLLTAEPAHVCIRSGTSLLRLPRSDQSKAVAKKPMRQDRRHQGKVESVPEGRFLTPKGDTWIFSAQVPFTEDPD